RAPRDEPRMAEAPPSPSPREGREERAGRAPELDVENQPLPVNCPPLANARPSRREGEKRRLPSPKTAMAASGWEGGAVGVLNSARSEAPGEGGKGLFRRTSRHFPSIPVV